MARAQSRRPRRGWWRRIVADRRQGKADEGSASEPLRSARRPYERPRLVDYGSVSKLTQTGGQTTKDLGNKKRIGT
jgi:hypothetical protein